MATEGRWPGKELRAAIKRQVFLTYKGFKQAVPEALPFVNEYIERKRLAKLGFTTSLADYPAWKADALVYIDSEIDRLSNEELKKKQKANKHGNRS